MNSSTALTPVQKLKDVLGADSVKEQFRNALADNSALFVASLIDIYANDQYLQKCPPQAVVMEALKAATLRLPINKSLGFAYIVPYGGEPQMQIGYKGYIQLAMRTGQYRYINAGTVCEGVTMAEDLLTGKVSLSGTKKSEVVVGYFAYMELLNGFTKAIYMTKEEMTAWAKRYSKSYSSKNSAWQTNFNEMGIKTVIRRLLSHYGVMSVEMAAAVTADDADERTPEARTQDEVDANANSETIDITPGAGEQEKPASDPGF